MTDRPVFFWRWRGGSRTEAALENSSSSQGVLSTHLFSDGDHYEWLYAESASGDQGKRLYIRMEGREIFKMLSVK